MSAYRHDPYSAAAYMVVMSPAHVGLPTHHAPQPLHQMQPIQPVQPIAYRHYPSAPAPAAISEFSDSDSLHLTESIGSDKEDSHRSSPAPAQQPKGKQQKRIYDKELKATDSEQVRQFVRSLASERVDNVIDRRVRSVSQEMCRRAVSLIGNDSEVMHQLCMVDRGNVVYQLMKRLRGEHCGALIAHGVKNFLCMALHQSGCIALSRMIETATPHDKDVLVRLCVEHFMRLAPHQYGNYTVQAALTAADEDTLSRLGLLMSEVDAVLGLTGSKFGSHVVEKFVKSAPISHVTGVVQSALGCSATLHHLAHDRFANYVLQAMLATVATNRKHLSRQFIDWVVDRVNNVLATSPHASNLGRCVSRLV